MYLTKHIFTILIYTFKMFSLQQPYPSFSSIDQIAKKSSKKHQKSMVKTKTKPKKSATTTPKPHET